MSEKSAGDKGFQELITFARSITPLPVEVIQSTSDDRWVSFGTDNLYPNFLLKLYGECALHRGIVGKKLNFLMGDGIVTKSDSKPFVANINQVDSAEELIQKLSYDFILFQAFAIEVQYDLLNNKPLYFNHIPINHIRSNKNRTRFWVCQDWIKRRDVLTYNRWIKGDNEDRKSKIFYYTGYAPSVNNIYPDVDYKAAITAMVTDMLINNWFKNNIEDGFSPAHIISFFKGVPTSEEGRDFERKFKATYSGSDGLKYLINYDNGGDSSSVKIDSIPSDDYATKLTEVIKKVENSILQSHSATRLLFGVETEGSLGGNGTELEIQYEIFKQTWVKNTRNVIESGLNKLFADAGLPAIEFKDKSSLFSTSLENATKEKVLTIDELRNIDGKSPLPNGAGQGLIGAAAPNMENGFAKDGKKLTGEDFELVKDFGVHRGEFEFVTDEALNFAGDDAIENYLISEKIDGKSIATIKADIQNTLGINTTNEAITEKINKLTQAKIISSDISNGKVNIKPVEQPKVSNEVQVMYEYVVRSGYGKPLIAASRDFCTKLINNDRLYTRTDIQQMSSIFGYDIFRHCGGWYFNSDTGQAENQCRHEWKMVKVIRKGNK
ncbi:hypothetical protein LJ707_13360 [Mucilaginibacter sp. UR6-1]|uniref:hypothetical protein n=1 Tax=Mucilaginibacter sp. UR6-1 TaxID=1435643 RepID=UPI001E645D65|nr:hypothetical protein [Mucilaginibacter sp. UR6-1]MCC8409920.1 hypothetical protein [Mucilaginibacter sp. UR6-1]